MLPYLLGGLMMLGGAALVFKVLVRRYKIEKRVIWYRWFTYKPPPPRKGYQIKE